MVARATERERERITTAGVKEWLRSNGEERGGSHTRTRRGGNRLGLHMGEERGRGWRTKVAEQCYFKVVTLRTGT